MRHSFPPKITQNECEVLETYNQSEFLYHWSLTAVNMVRRGLLEEHREIGSYRLTKRGELMARRFRKQQNDLAFKQQLAGGAS